MKIKFQSRAKNAFLTLELVIVMIIAISLMGASMIAGRKMLKSADVSRIISEYETLSQGIIQFYGAKNRIPGDIPLAEMGGNLNSTILQANVSKISVGCTANKCITASGQITGIKAVTAFQEMASAGLISDNLASISYTIASSNACLASTTENFYTLRNKLIPGSRYSKQASWILGMDSSLSTENLSPANSVIYNPTIYPTFNGKPRLILFNASNYRGTGGVTCEVDVANTNAAFMGSGAVSPDIAYEIDIKIDDGLPSLGWIVSENDRNALQKCTDGLLDATTNVSTRKYTNSDANNGKEGCVMTFLINILA